MNTTVHQHECKNTSFIEFLSGREEDDPQPSLSFECNRRPEGPAAGAKRPHATERGKGERSETVVPEATD